jgi:C-terminal processing protease CtpA/Prc
LSAIDGNEASKGVTISKISAQSQAEQCEDLTVGDILVKIGTIDVRQKKLSDVMALLKTTKRPMVLTFKLGDDDDSD